MTFFLDENFPKSAENFLQSLGHTTYHVYQTEFQGSEDEKLFSLAQEQKAIFLTTDKDFLCILYNSNFCDSKVSTNSCYILLLHFTLLIVSFVS